MTTPLLSVENLAKHYHLSAPIFGGSLSVVRAVDGVSFDIARGETLSIVGESGCGKSTVGKTVLRLTDPTSGAILLDGQRIDSFRESELRDFRKRVQVVFQDPFSSLNPKQRVFDILAEPLRNFRMTRSREELEERIAELLEMVGLPQDAARRFPHEFSGGQRQRIGIARALAPEPELIICDEAVSALDVSVKAQIVNLLQDLQKKLGLALLFISHDLAVVENITHRVLVMYLGRVVEIGPKREIFVDPAHPYTKALLSAVPVPDPEVARQRVILTGDVPSPIRPPAGCHFHTRCPLAYSRCREEVPPLQELAAGHHVACHLVETEEGRNSVRAMSSC